MKLVLERSEGPNLKAVLFLLLLPGILMILGSNMGVAGLECCGLPEVAAEEAIAPAFVETSPTVVTAGSGEVHTVYVTVLDKDRRALPNILIRASSDTPNRASVEPEEVRTDENGKAVFTVKGVSYVPGSKATITFKAGDAVGKLETVFQYL